MAKFAALRSTQQRGRGVAVRRAAKPAQATVRRPSKPQPALAQAEGQRVEFLSLMRRYDQCAEKVEAARGEMREMLADAKIAGFKGAWFRLARLLRGESEALATRVRNEVDDRLKIGKWVGDTRLTVQFDLVANAVAVPIAADPYQEGRQAGLEGASPKPPGKFDQAGQQKWLMGYHEATAERVRANIRPTEEAQAMPVVPPNGPVAGDDAIAADADVVAASAEEAADPGRPL